MGHPYYDVIDNGTDFEAKVTKMINVSLPIKAQSSSWHFTYGKSD